MTFSRIERIAAYIAQQGKASTRQIADALGVSAEVIGNSLKHASVRANWGIIHMGYDEDARSCGRAPVLWGINARHYRLLNKPKIDFAEYSRETHVKKRKRPTRGQAAKTPKEIRRPAECRPTYRGPSLTRWQPSSPYYEENT